MQLATIRIDGSTAAARVDGDELVLLPYPDVGRLLAVEADWRSAARAGGTARLPVREADFAPVVPFPEKVVCVGVNYRDHCEEVGITPPEFPTFFAKYHRALIGADDPLVLPSNSNAVDWEIELGVVIGAAARHVSEADALSAVAGYTIVNDVSMRDWQLRTSQFLQGKTFEASSPLGPFVVTPDEVGDATDLNMTLRVGDEVMQRSSTSMQLFSVAQVISYLSQIITLVPGDVIATGTPSGVGGARKPARYLAAGDVVRASIDGLGEQCTRCVARADDPPS
jgi:acylpyruvate hydrolase